MSSPFHLGTPRAMRPGCGWLRLEEYVRVGTVHHEATGQYEWCLALLISVVGVFVGRADTTSKDPVQRVGRCVEGGLEARDRAPGYDQVVIEDQDRVVFYFPGCHETQREPITIIETPVVTVDDLTAWALERKARPLSAVRNVNLIDEGMPSE